MDERAAPQGPSEILDFGDAVSGFFVRGTNGRLISLAGFSLSRDLRKVAPRTAPTDLAILDPFIGNTKPSSLMLMLHLSARAQSYFLTDSTIAGARRTMKIFEGTEEIVLNCLDNQQFPVIELEDMKRAILAGRESQAPVSLQVRHLDLRDSIPRSWLTIIRDIFEANLRTSVDKSITMEGHLTSLRQRVRSTMFDRYLSHCTWVDSHSGEVGTVNPSKLGEVKRRLEFAPFTGGDVHMADFIDSLARDEQGNHVTTFGRANVYPIPLPRKEWSSPTLHIYDRSFRERLGLDEYYSLYRGLDILSQMGAPVLVYDRNQLGRTIPVRVLKPSPKGGDLVSLSVSSFSSRHVVWDKSSG